MNRSVSLFYKNHFGVDNKNMNKTKDKNKNKKNDFAYKQSRWFNHATNLLYNFYSPKQTKDLEHAHNFDDAQQTAVVVASKGHVVVWYARLCEGKDKTQNSMLIREHQVFLLDWDRVFYLDLDIPCRLGNRDRTRAHLWHSQTWVTDQTQKDTIKT